MLGIASIWKCDPVIRSHSQISQVLAFLMRMLSSTLLFYLFKLKNKQTSSGIFVQTSRGYLLKLLGEHSHSKAASQGENILQLIKILFV